MSLATLSNSQKAFSRAACQYDRFSALQKEIGLGLIEKIPAKPYQHILDIGMGTGWLTEKCGQRFPGAQTTGLDDAPGMVEYAKRRDIDHVFEADAQELPFENESFDLVISNCVYQWVEDLPKAFGEAARVLSAEGDFFFTFFGAKTLKELREAMQQGGPYEQTISAQWHLLHQDNIHSFLRQAGFQEIALFSETKKEVFNDFLSLVHWLKAIGANRTKRNTFVGRKQLAQASTYYQQHFSTRDGVLASFEIISGVAHK